MTAKQKQFRDIRIQISLIPWWPTVVQRKHKDFQTCLKTSPSQRYKYMENTLAAHINKGHDIKLTCEYKKYKTIIWPSWTAHYTAKPPPWHCVPLKAEEKSCV